MKSDCRPDVEGRIKAATVCAEDVDAVAKSYADYFGYEQYEDTAVSEAQACAWNAPGMAGKRIVTMGPESGSQVFIRIVENKGMPAYEPLKSFGWNAIELTIQDADALNERLKNSPFKVVGEPALLDFSDKIYPMQAVGFANELFYLNEVRGNLPDYDLPMARSFVDHTFIMILATPNMQEAIDFYTKNLGWAQGNAYYVKYSVINEAYNLPEETPHHLSMTCVGRDVNNEVDQYPKSTVVRNCAEGMLPPGIAMVSYMVQSLDDVSVDFIAPPQAYDGIPYNGRRAASCVGAAGELIELIEIGQ